MIRILTIIAALNLWLQYSVCQTNPNDKFNKDLKSEYTFLKAYETKQVPYTDSTNFDNYKPNKFLSSDQCKLLNLDQIITKDQMEYGQTKVGINYILNISEKYNTIVVFIYYSEMELSSIMINYNDEYNIIDYKTIAMDEIAESLFRTESTIEKNHITITNYKFFNETIEEKELIEIKEDGALLSK